MYMNKTSILWSVWEGEHLGVSTFLPNHIKCTQGWIFYLFGFFFRTPPYRALDFWTWKITRNFTSTQVATPSVMQRRCWACPAPASGHSWGRLVPKSWDLSPKQSDLPGPDNWDGMAVSFSCSSMSHPTITLPWQGDIYFQGEHSYLMENIFFVWKSVWNIPGLEWCRKLWQNIRTVFSCLDISALPEIKPFW